MQQAEYTGIDPAVIILIALNLVAGFGFAIPLAKLLGRVSAKPRGFFHYFAVIGGLYFVESVALAMGMGVPVFSVGLAFVWGIVFGLRLRAHAPVPREPLQTREVLKTTFFLSLYSSLPAFSFIVVPVIIIFAGNNVLSAEAGASFGIPSFLPWPLTTILGFYAACAIGAVVLKTAITTGEVRLLIRVGEKAAA
jgi:hypothetical protein